MPTIVRATDIEDEIELKLFKHYEDEPPREGVHVSDLNTCIRQGELRKKYGSKFTLDTLLRFTLGRAFEKAIGQFVLPEATQELQLVEDDIHGSIDFAADVLDYEFKLTWKKTANTEEEIEKLFDDNWYWLDQACSYAIMRRRRSHLFAVLSVAWFIPTLRVYKVTWTEEEQGDTWRMMRNNRDYLLACRKQGILPYKTQFKKFCNFCDELKDICEMIPEEDLELEEVNE